MSPANEPEPLQFFCDARRHLVCVPYSVANLHRMATELAIARAWFHSGDKPHYDIPKRRIAEITARCQVVTPRRILEIILTDQALDIP